MLIVNEMPFKFVEYEGLKKFLSVACFRFKLPSKWSLNERHNLKNF